jgi:hypothetical protein
VETDGVCGTIRVEYGDNCMNQRKGYKWVEIFTGRLKYTVVGVRSGRTSSATRIEVKEHAG